MLDIKKLQYLEAVYRHRSFTRASEELFVSQSAISMSIKSLEEELGVKLIVRSPQNVAFTYEGEQLVLHARRILLDCENTEREMAELSETKNSVLHLGVSPTLGIRFLNFIQSEKFHQMYPKAAIYIEEGAMSSQIGKLRQDVLDLSYNGLPSPADAVGLELTPVTSARISAILRPDHPMANRGVLSMGDLDGAEVVMLDENSLIRAQVMAEFRRTGSVPKIRSSHEQIFCMLNAVKLGNFIGFLNSSDPYIEQHLHRMGLITRELSPSIEFQVGFISKCGRRLPRIAAALTEIAEKLESGDRSGGDWDELGL